MQGNSKTMQIVLVWQRQMMYLFFVAPEARSLSLTEQSEREGRERRVAKYRNGRERKEMVK